MTEGHDTHQRTAWMSLAKKLSLNIPKSLTNLYNHHFRFSFLALAHKSQSVKKSHRQGLTSADDEEYNAKTELTYSQPMPDDDQ